MPKISAPSVAEHHEVQLRAILEAAYALIHEERVMPGLAQVAARAGLARTSVYQYFSSRAELLVAVAEDMLPAWESHLQASVDEFTDPRDRILAYFDTNLAMLATGHHTAGTVMAGDPAASQAADEHTKRFHMRLRRVLTDELTRLDVADPDLTAEILDAQLHAVAAHVTDGSLGLDEAKAALRAVVDPFLRSLVGPQPPA